MKIKVGLNQKSVKNTINALKTAKKQLQGEMLNEFYKECYNYFVSRANYHLLSSDIGELVIAEIQSSWNFERTVNGAKFTNNAEKAVYVEFGVGYVGGNRPHTNAKELGNNYEYNVKPGGKYEGQYHNEDTWRFYVKNKNEVDLKEGYYEEWYTKDNRIKIITEGSPAVMYAFNALEDLRLEYKNIWERIKIKYWG